LFGAMTYSIIMHRKSFGPKASQFTNYPSKSPWNVVPFSIR